jgi:hypothetical protein
VNDTKGAHARFSYLRRIFKESLLQQLEADNEGGMEEKVQKLRAQALRIYLLYLVGITLFTDKSAHYVDVVSEAWRLLLVIHGELLHYHTCIGSLTMLPIGTPSICQNT